MERFYTCHQCHRSTILENREISVVNVYLWKAVLHDLQYTPQNTLTLRLEAAFTDLAMVCKDAYGVKDNIRMIFISKYGALVVFNILGSYEEEKHGKRFLKSLE